MTHYELNMDGLVGPTHHYAGLAEGNVASLTHAHMIANPKEAAKQGLKKMRLLHELGLKQAVLPPHQRPHQTLLSQFGFSGALPQQLKQAHTYAPELLSACFSASSMWTANMATITPSQDTQDERVHFTAANLTHHLHRRIEAEFSSQLLKYLFSNEQHFKHHMPLFSSTTLGDEGAANHNRLCLNHASCGIHLFVYGKRALSAQSRSHAPRHFPARQSFEASSSIARRHTLTHQNSLFVQQNPHAIDEGVFHNDVISVANESLLLFHEDAFLNARDVLEELQQKATFPLQLIEIKREHISVKDAVNSYLFNSQIVSLSSGHMAIIAPAECHEHVRIRALIEALIKDTNNPIGEVHYQDLKQSMQNGGGPACLRLRVVLSDKELQQMHQGVLINHERLTQLEQWVDKHYRDRLHSDDLVDPKLIEESYTALDELTQLLQLGSIYPFQQTL